MLGYYLGLIDRSVFFCSDPPLYFFFENSKNTRYELARPVMGTIFLVYICMYVFNCLWENNTKKRILKCVGGIT